MNSFVIKRQHRLTNTLHTFDSSSVSVFSLANTWQPFISIDRAFSIGAADDASRIVQSSGALGVLNIISKYADSRSLRCQ